MYKNILCAVDVSRGSESVLEKANALAEKHGAHLSIVHIIEYGFLPRNYQRKLKEEVLPKIEKLAESYKIAKKRRYIKFGQPYPEICAVAEKHKIDLVMIGSHGKHGMRTLLGSTANGVVHHSECDVLVVKVK